MECFSDIWLKLQSTFLIRWNQKSFSLNIKWRLNVSSVCCEQCFQIWYWWRSCCHLYLICTYLWYLFRLISVWSNILGKWLFKDCIEWVTTKMEPTEQWAYPNFKLHLIIVFKLSTQKAHTLNISDCFKKLILIEMDS